MEKTADGRSPFRTGPLQDLRLAPTADDPRPLFIPSAEAPRTWETHQTYPFPRLMWSPQGGEVTVGSASERDALLAQGYTLDAPGAVVVNPIFDLQQALAGLSPEERSRIVEAQAADRLEALKNRLVALSPEDLRAVLEGLGGDAKRVKKTA